MKQFSMTVKTEVPKGDREGGLMRGSGAGRPLTEGMYVVLPVTYRNLQLGDCCLLQGEGCGSFLALLVEEWRNSAPRFLSSHFRVNC